MSKARKNTTLKILLVLLVLFVSGCGSHSAFNPINPPAVQASGVLPNCDANGACSATIFHAWGYCQWTSLQTAKTFSVSFEVGMNANAPANDASICTVPFGLGGGVITSISGNSNSTPSAASNTPLDSLWINVRSCTVVTCEYPNHQEHLATQKYTTKGVPQSLPFSGTFPAGIPSAGIMLVFNDDLATAKPVTISVAFSGTFQ